MDKAQPVRIGHDIPERSLANGLLAEIERFGSAPAEQPAPNWNATLDIDPLAAHEGCGLWRSPAAESDRFHLQILGTNPETPSAYTGRIQIRVQPRQQHVPEPTGTGPYAKHAYALPVRSPAKTHAWLTLQSDEQNPAAGERFGPCAASLGQFLWRYERAWHWATIRGTPRWFVGSCPPMLELERLIAIAAASDITAHVIAPPGSLGLLTAHSIHASDTTPCAPFRELDAVSCERSPGRISELLAQMQGGTLVIRGLGRYPVHEIPRLLAAQSLAAGRSGRTRLILLDDKDARTIATGDAIDAALSQIGGTIRIPVPSLAKRAADLREIIASHALRYALTPSRLEQGALDVFHERSQTIGDEAGLEQVIARLAARHPDGPINAGRVRDAIPDRSGSGPHRPYGFVEAKPPSAAFSIGSEDPLASALLNDEYTGPGHDAAIGALRWAAKNHARDITTHDAADAAHVSSSHFSHLLKAEFGTSFRLLLSRIRIEHARRLLREPEDHTVTDIALDVGFGDLSHFIKSFSRFTGMTPREYRKRVRALREGIENSAQQNTDDRPVSGGEDRHEPPQRDAPATREHAVT